MDSQSTIQILWAALENAEAAAEREARTAATAADAAARALGAAQARPIVGTKHAYEDRVRRSRRAARAAKIAAFAHRDAAAAAEQVLALYPDDDTPNKENKQ